MTNKKVDYIEKTPENDMRAIVKFTDYCTSQLQQVNRKLNTSNDCIYSVLGYKHAIDDLLGGDVLSYVMKEFLRCMLGTPEQQKKGYAYFMNR